MSPLKNDLLSGTAAAALESQRKGEHKKHDKDTRLEPLVVSIRDAMHLLGDSRSTIYRKIRQGRLKSHRDGGRRKVDFQSVKALAEQPSP